MFFAFDLLNLAGQVLLDVTSLNSGAYIRIEMHANVRSSSQIYPAVSSSPGLPASFFAQKHSREEAFTPAALMPVAVWSMFVRVEVMRVLEHQKGKPKQQDEQSHEVSNPAERP